MKYPVTEKDNVCFIYTLKEIVMESPLLKARFVIKCFSCIVVLLILKSTTTIIRKYNDFKPLSLTKYQNESVLNLNKSSLCKGDYTFISANVFYTMKECEQEFSEVF